MNACTYLYFQLAQIEICSNLGQYFNGNMALKMTLKDLKHSVTVFLSWIIQVYVPTKCNCLLLGAQGSFSDKLLGRRGGRVEKGMKTRPLRGLKTPLRPDGAVEGINQKCSEDETIWIYVVFFVFLLPRHRLVLYCPQHVPNSMWNVALLALLTSLNSSGDRGQGHSLALVFMVRWNVNSGWEKRGEVIMRHPPSAGCLFGQTGCLTAQAVDGILMDMTNDSLSPFSRFLPTRLFFSHFSFSFCRMCMKLKILNSQGFKMHNSFTTQGTAVTCTRISESFGAWLNTPPLSFIITHWWVDIKPSLVFAAIE